MSLESEDVDAEQIQKIREFSEQLQDLIAKYATVIKSPEIVIKLQMASVIATICGYGIGDELTLWSCVFSQMCFEGTELLKEGENER